MSSLVLNRERLDPVKTAKVGADVSRAVVVTLMMLSVGTRPNM